MAQTTDAKKPYGDVEYADPGYQADGKKRYPLDTEEHCRAAWSYINQEKNAAKYTPEQLSKIKARIKAAGKKYDITFDSDSSSRSDEILLASSWLDEAAISTEFIRAVTLDDIRIRSGGTGRTVEAYAAIFDEEAEVIDQDGHYLERNAPVAFNRTIARHQERFPVVYHHGLTIAGTPSERGSVPIGVSTEVRVDKRGVLTISEYGRSELADEVLEAIRTGAVRAQSYGGKFTKSDPRRPAGGFRRGFDGKLRTVTRLEIAMREFGPTPFPAFTGAAITGIRTQQILGALLAAPRERRAALLDQLDLLAPRLAEAAPVSTETVDTPDPEQDPDAVEQTEDSPLRPSARSIPLRTRIRAARIARGWE